MSTWVTGLLTGLSCTALGVATVALACQACSSGNPPPPSTGTTGGTDASNPCTGEAGEFPTPNCDNTAESCTAPVPACPTAPCAAGSPCLAMADNSGKTTQDFRLRKLNVTAPPRLANLFTQTAVIDQGINLKNLCGEGGDGSFNWLLRFDPAGGKLTTGGAPSSPDPLGVGYCFARETVGSLAIGAVTVNLTMPGGAWSTDPIPKLNVPVYAPTNGGVPIILPLTNARLQAVTISADGNCVGSYNPDGVSSPSPGMTTCLDQAPSECQRWHTAGSIGGYITLEEAEQVWIRQESETLCALLTVGVGGTSNCPTDASGHITAMGDFCSTTQMPGGCADSFWLAATFAASAVTITDTSTDPQCNGAVLSADGGVGSAEAGTVEAGGTEAGADAAME